MRIPRKKKKFYKKLWEKRDGFKRIIRKKSIGYSHGVWGCIADLKIERKKK